VRRDHRPLYIKRLIVAFERWYGLKFLAPQFESLGKGVLFMRPWHVEIFGGPVYLGDYAHVIATADGKVRLTVWAEWGQAGLISLGDHCLICPGVRISAAREIRIGNSCMLAQGVYITDADWHGLYDRAAPVGQAKPVTIGENVWIGDRAMVTKGVTIGDNAVIGAGSVVVKDVPPNVIAAGNPAEVVKELRPDGPFRTRSQWLSNPGKLKKEFAELERADLEANTLYGWLRSLLFPRRGD
jgi:acetyltransferase-like isoleucine patch superfamily enzyme